MPKPDLSAVLDILDPMLSDNFDMKFSSVPGGGNQRALTVQCKTALKPGVNLQEVEIELFGHKVLHASKKMWTNEMAIEYIEDSKGSITVALENWAELIRGTDSGHGAFKSAYAVDAIFTIYDQEGSVAMEYKIINCWPSQIPDLQFDGTGGQNVPMNASFKFDHVARVRGG
jgi:hypothetical protein